MDKIDLRFFRRVHGFLAGGCRRALDREIMQCSAALAGAALVMTKLDRITSLDEIRHAIRAFNDSSFDRTLSRDLLKNTTYWVQDSATGRFGPSKFCGFSNLNSAAYQQAMRGQSEGAPFSGYETRKAIEEVVGNSFNGNETLKREFISWANAKFGSNSLDQVSQDKWQFLSLPAATSSGADLRQTPTGRAASAATERAVNHEQRAAHIWNALVQAANEQRTITYGEVAAAASIHHRALKWPLELIQAFCLEEHQPPLTSIVVHAGDTLPGIGFTAWDVGDLDTAHKTVFSFDWRAQMNPFTYAMAGDTEETLAHRLVTTPELADEVYRQVKVRGRAQVVFRKALIEAYGGACAFCGLTFAEALDAAHILPWSVCGSADRVSPLNGLLLCSNHHEMFDAGWLRINKATRLLTLI